LRRYTGCLLENWSHRWRIRDPLIYETSSSVRLSSDILRKLSERTKGRESLDCWISSLASVVLYSVMSLNYSIIPQGLIGAYISKKQILRCAKDDRQKGRSNGGNINAMNFRLRRLVLAETIGEVEFVAQLGGAEVFAQVGEALL
jgi:hypothetical protein